MYGNNYNLERLTRQKDEIENLIRTYQQTSQPVMNTYVQDMYEIKILNDGDEAEKKLTYLIYRELYY